MGDDGVLQAQGIGLPQVIEIEVHLPTEGMAVEVGVGELHLIQGANVMPGAEDSHLLVAVAYDKGGAGGVGLAVEVGDVDIDAKAEVGLPREVNATVGLRRESDVEGTVGGGGGAVGERIIPQAVVSTEPIIGLARNGVPHLGAAEIGAAIGSGAAAQRIGFPE